MGDEIPEAVAPPGLAVTVYELMALPPLEAGAAKLTVAEPVPATALTVLGAPGLVTFGTTVIVVRARAMVESALLLLRFRENVPFAVWAQFSRGTRTVWLVTPGKKVRVPCWPT
jgi:hypothetical protein